MTAFGPYREQEVIDFTELENNQIFVISGTTGSGKTTIFDGICYALYGSVSGEDRDNAGNVRSDFAEDKMHTAIELIFEMKGKRYRILRQLAHVKKGNKTATGEKNEFVEMTNTQEVPVLDSHKVRDMNNKLEEIIGLTKEQFKQIVMLPQGEFQKLLTSDSQNKGDILRKIFKTESFKKMAESMQKKKADAEKQLEVLKSEETVYIATLKDIFPRRESLLFEVLEKDYRSSGQIIKALKEEIVYYSELVQQIAEQHAIKKETVENKRQLLQEAQQFNKERQLYLEAKQRLIQLQQQLEAIASAREKVANAENAQHIIPYENAFRQQREELMQLKEQLEQVTTKLAVNKQQSDFALETLNFFSKQQQQQDERKQQLTEWKRILPYYEEVTAVEKNFEGTILRLQDVTNQQVTAHKKLEDLKSYVANHEQQKIKLQLQIADYEIVVTQLATIEKIASQVTVKRQNEQYIIEQQQQQKALQLTIQQQQMTLNDLENSWLANQAYVLATQLVSGEPCPVCGSRVHEQIHGSEGELVTKDQLDVAKRALSQNEQKNYNISAIIKQSEALILQAKLVLSDFAEVNYDEATITETIAELKRHIQDKQRQKQQLLIIEKEIMNKRLEIETNRQTLQLIQQQVNEQQVKHRELQTILQQKRQQLPNQFTTQQQLVQAMNEVGEAIHHFDSKLLTLQRESEYARQQLLITETSLRNKNEQLTEDEKKLTVAQQVFQEKVFEAGFLDGKAYTSARLNEQQLAQYKQQIIAFDKEYYAIEQQIIARKERFEKQEPRDLSTLQQQLNEVVEAVDELNNQLSQMNHRLNNGQRLNEQLQFTQQQTESLEHRAGQIIKLFELLSGKNEQKISFERYLQIEYLEQIIHAANERLLPLSNGQYRLSRSPRLDGNGKQSGLSLDVYDSYTGQERDVKTLSGGEQFNASLCLALGMSDIIQSFKGNVHMDTMFIDEGFGTLDEESLAKAIDTLVDLQKTGRMIGIISHVAELKDTIPATLEVKKTKEGFSHTRFVIK